MMSIAAWAAPLSPMSKRPNFARRSTDSLPTGSSRLTLLVVVAALPLLAFAAFMIVRYAEVDRARYEQQLQSTTHATSNAMDAELLREFAILDTLSKSRSLADQEWPAFYDLAKASIENQAAARIVLYDLSGQLIMATLVPYGTPCRRRATPVQYKRW